MDICGKIIEFEDGHDYAGLQVTLRSASTGLMLEMAGLADELGGGEADGDLAPEKAGAIRSLFGLLAGCVVGWNVDDDDDKPVTPDLDGLRSQDPVMIMAVFTAWFQRVTLVAPPLPQGSESGPAAREESLGLESLSASLAS